MKVKTPAECHCLSYRFLYTKRFFFTKNHPGTFIPGRKLAEPLRELLIQDCESRRINNPAAELGQKVRRGIKPSARITTVEESGRECRG
jgi:hypothetical protein